MSKFILNISGDCNIGSLAIGTGAVAVGSVTGGTSKSKDDCGHCGAPIKNCEKCPFCNTDYPRKGIVSVQFED